MMDIFWLNIQLVYIAIVEIDGSREDSLNFNNFAVSSIKYEPIGNGLVAGEGDGNLVSQKIECDSSSGDDSATVYYYNNDDCTDTGDESTGLFYTKTFKSGRIENNMLYVVHCSNDDSTDGTGEFEDCSAIIRRWYAADMIEATQTEDAYCVKQEDSYTDVLVMLTFGD